MGDVCDFCPDIADPEQPDLDLDNVGDACDEDRDGDNVANDEDNCPDVWNEGQTDIDEDGTGDECQGFYSDQDGDSFPDFADDCPLVPNPPPLVDCEAAGANDTDGDGTPDAEDDCLHVPGICGNDNDGDGVPDDEDNCPDVPNPDQRPAAEGEALGEACAVSIGAH